MTLEARRTPSQRQSLLVCLHQRSCYHPELTSVLQDTVTVDTTPWLIPELTEAEKSAQKTKASGDSVHATIPSTLFATAETHPLLPVYFSKSPIAHTWQYITFAYVL